MVDALTEANIARVLDAIYDASLSPSHWPAVLASLGALYRSHFADVFTRSHDRTVYRGLSFGLDRTDYQDLFLDTWFKRNVWGLTKPVRDAGEVLSTRQMVDVDVLKHSEIYADYLDSRELHEGLRFAIWADDVGIQDISLLRPWSAGPFEGLELDVGRRIIPHLQRSVAIARRLKYAEASAAAGLTALESVGFAVFVLDRGGCAVLLNRPAEALVRSRDGLAIDQGRLIGATPAATRRLSQAIARGIRADALIRSATSVRLPRPSGAAPLTLVTVPLRGDADWTTIRAPALMALVADPDSRAPSLHQLSTLFDLTEAEAELASALLAGHELREIAEKRGRSIHTVRNHLARLMGKTETRRQSELMLLLRDVPREPEILGPG